VAAFAYEVDGEERVGIVAEVERRQKDAWAPPTDRRCQEATPRLPPAPFPFDPEEVMASIMRAVAELHGIRVDRVALIQAGSIPKTTSGKIQRQASKMALLSGRIQPITRESEERRLKEEAARNELRERITDIIAETASIPRERLHARSSLHAYGIDSLTGVNIAYEIGLLLGQDVPSWLLSEQDTIEKIVAYAISRGGAR
jgi:acyl carrier protein